MGTPPGPQRYFRDLDERLASGALDLSLPFRAFGNGAQLKVGGLAEQTDPGLQRAVLLLRARPVAWGSDGVDGAALSGYLSPENVGVVGTRTNAAGEITQYEFGHFLVDATRDQNQYDGTFDVLAGYGMAEVGIGRLRLIAGARYEASRLFVASQALASTDTPAGQTVTVDGTAYLGTDRTYNDVLPSLNAVYGLTDRMNLRAAATRTLARPTFREIAPVTTYDFTSDGALQGNPGLERTLITNLDLRWEWFSGPGDIVAVSGYYKRLDNPIERVITDAENGATSYANVAQADVLGAEFEVRQRLGAFGLGGVLGERLSLGANLSLTQSSISISERELAARRQLNPRRADTRDLQGQSPYLLNANLSYADGVRGTSAAVFFNVSGPRLSRVGNPLPDVYERPSPQLDLTASQRVFGAFTLKGSVRNVLGSVYREAYDVSGLDLGGASEVSPFLEHALGTSFSLGLVGQPLVRRRCAGLDPGARLLGRPGPRHGRLARLLSSPSPPTLQSHEPLRYHGLAAPSSSPGPPWPRCRPSRSAPTSRPTRPGRASQVYLLDGLIFVRPGATLTIEAGTIIKGKEVPSAATGDLASGLVVDGRRQHRGERDGRRPDHHDGRGRRRLGPERPRPRRPRPAGAA